MSMQKFQFFKNLIQRFCQGQRSLNVPEPEILTRAWTLELSECKLNISMACLSAKSNEFVWPRVLQSPWSIFDLCPNMTLVWLYIANPGQTKLSTALTPSKFSYLELVVSLGSFTIHFTSCSPLLYAALGDGSTVNILTSLKSLTLEVHNIVLSRRTGLYWTSAGGQAQLAQPGARENEDSRILGYLGYTEAQTLSHAKFAKAARPCLQKGWGQNNIFSLDWVPPTSGVQSD